MPTRATVVSRVTALVHALVANRRGLVPLLFALASLLVSVAAAATTPLAATTVVSPREAQSAECHVYVIALRVPHDRAKARRLGAPDARSAASTTGREGPHTARGRRSDKLIGLTGLGKYGSKCSGWYFGGELGGMVLGIVQGPAALGKSAVVEGAQGASKALETTFEILDGVRRSKAAELAGKKTILAEVIGSGGKVVEVSLGALRSPKSVIEAASASGLSRWLSTLKQTLSGSQAPAILIQPGTRGIPIAEVAVSFR